MGFNFDVDYVDRALEENPSLMAEAVRLHRVKHRSTLCASISTNHKTKKPRLNYSDRCVSSLAWHYRKLVGPKLAKREPGRHSFRNEEEKYEYDNSNDGLRDRIEELEDQNSRLRCELGEVTRNLHDLRDFKDKFDEYCKALCDERERVIELLEAKNTMVNKINKLEEALIESNIFINLLEL